MSEKMRKTLILIGAGILAIVWLVWVIFFGVEPIEDINGPDDFSLAVITDEEIIREVSKSTGIGWTKSMLGDTVKIHSRNFSGIEQIKAETILYSTGVQLDMFDFEVNAGNFRMVVINEDQIIMDITPETEFPLDLGALNGHTRLVIAGESADFSFQMWESDLDLDQAGLN